MISEKKKVILVTGSAKGIGAHLIRRFADNGRIVIINYIHSKDHANTLLKELHSSYETDSAMCIRADVSDRSEVTGMFDSVINRYHRIDVLINNAGINRDKPFLLMTDEDWEVVIKTILTGCFICSQEFARRYQGTSGHIINIGAVTALRGRMNGANYCSARAGIITLTQCLALELSPYIRVNCVTPGWINTDEVIERYGLHEPDRMKQTLDTIPMKRLGTPEDIFSIINYIVSDSGYIMGQNLFVDGGRSMF